MCVCMYVCMYVCIYLLVCAADTGPSDATRLEPQSTDMPPSQHAGDVLSPSTGAEGTGDTHVPRTDNGYMYNDTIKVYTCQINDHTISIIPCIIIANNIIMLS